MLTYNNNQLKSKSQIIYLLHPLSFSWPFSLSKQLALVQVSHLKETQLFKQLSTPFRKFPNYQYTISYSHLLNQRHARTSNHGLCSSAGLKMPIHAQFYRPAIWTRKVGQGDLVFDVRLGCACKIRSVLCTAVRTCATLVVPKFYSYILTPCDPEK